MTRKKSTATKAPSKIIITHYVLTKIFERETAVEGYNIFYRYNTVDIFHPGCYKKSWHMHFASEKHLVQYLRKLFPQKKSFSFTSDLEGISAHAVTLINSEKKTYQLKKPKKRNPMKKSRKYWCDCYYCESDNRKKHTSSYDIMEDAIII